MCLNPRFPGAQAIVLERDARAAQAFFLQRRDQRIALERADEEHEIAAAAGAEQLAADRAIGLGQFIDARRVRSS